ncbi:hypothetical protein Belba_2359 [Belliella baltica DSM 15883]|uniref:Uncharacterized protein n=1 Tax=Belliella baltica (strain DSM 15883 / CIP 108006 / LMG 21964 / BA134) TaxID=866536 RepID=I3Z6Q1_BELBD|nr:hypothetical protein [Belliella baltica]AFL84919.1 hypothetical protein Belba_2359 [Belliella baltica DSM 15883]
MIRFIALLVFSALFMLFLGPFFSYPILMIGVFILAYLVGGNGAISFFAGGLSFGLVWLFQAFYIAVQTNSSLPDKMAELMGIGESNLLLVATGILGFLLGGFSALTGSLLRNLFKKKRDQGIYRY